MKRKHYLVIAGCISLGLVIVVVLVGVVRRSVSVGLSNGDSARITFSKNSCKVVYQPRDGEAGTVAFYASSILQLDIGQPALITPATDSHCLLILYDADVHYRLLRVDPSKPFTRFPENSYLSYIVQSSSWKIEEGTSNDWEEVCSHLKTLPQETFNREAVTTLDLGLARFHYGRQELLSEVEREIYNSSHGLVY